jgi:hypothetical protein
MSAPGRGSRTGISAEIGGRVMPAIWDVDSGYGAAHAAASAQIAAGGPLQPSLSLRLRGEHIFGTAPFFDLATIGGAGSLRGFSQQRFRGDNSVVASTEARIRLARALLVLPADIGVMGVGDVGRVFLDDDSSDIWHGAAGGGLWISWLDDAGSLAISVVASSEHTMLYSVPHCRTEAACHSSSPCVTPTSWSSIPSAPSPWTRCRPPTPGTPAPPWPWPRWSITCGRCLWQDFLRFDPEDPIWPNRDRFVLSNGHASMLLYSMLHLTSCR